jgi:hypothetical protein
MNIETKKDLIDCLLFDVRFSIGDVPK